MKIDCTKTLKGLDGEVIKDGDKDFTVGKAVTLALNNASKEVGGVYKLYNLLREFNEKKSVELDKADAKMVKTAVENVGGWNIIIKGQLLDLFEDAESKDK